MVIATILIAIIMVLMFGVQVPFTGTPKITIEVKLPGAAGIMEGTPVKKYGVTIGRVEKVVITDDGPVVTVSVDDDKLRKGDKCRVKSSIIGGDATLEFLSSHETAKQPFLKSGTTVEGVVSPDPIQMMADLATMVTSLEGDVKSALGSVETAGTQVGKLAENLNKVFDGTDGEEMQGLTKKAEETLDSVTLAMNSISNIFGDEKVQADLKKALSDMPELMTTTKKTLEDFQTAVETANENMENLKGFTGPLGDHGAEIVNDLRDSAGLIDELLTQVTSFTKALNSSEGTIGQLVHNPGLYQKLERAAGNIERTSQRLRPIIEDVRIITDKIARDPGGELGVRGAFRRSSGIK